MDHSARIVQLKRALTHLAEAIASGALRASPTLAARLTAAEEEVERLTSAQVAPAAPSADVTRLLADLPTPGQRAPWSGSRRLSRRVTFTAPGRRLSSTSGR